MPKESRAWDTAQAALSPFGQLCRVENSLIIGFPDALYCLLGVTGFIETKATAASLTIEQVLFSEKWTRSGGLCHTLLRADRTWFLLDAAGTRRLFEKKEPEPVVRSTGPFPLKEMLSQLAPISRRYVPPRLY